MKLLLIYFIASVYLFYLKLSLISVSNLRSESDSDNTGRATSVILSLNCTENGDQMNEFYCSNIAQSVFYMIESQSIWDFMVIMNLVLATLELTTKIIYSKIIEDIHSDAHDEALSAFQIGGFVITVLTIYEISPEALFGNTIKNFASESLTKSEYNFAKYKFSTLGWMIIVAEVNFKCLKYSLFVAVDEFQTVKSGLWKSLKLCILLLAIIVVQILQIYFYLIFEDEINNGFKAGPFNFKLLEWVAIRATVYELIGTLEGFGTIVISIICLNIQGNAELTNSMYLFILGSVLMWWFSNYVWTTYFGMHIVIGFTVYLILKLEQIFTAWMGLANLWYGFRVTKEEIHKFEIDNIGTLCQDEIDYGGLLKCDHNYHFEGLKQIYFNTRQCGVGNQQIHLDGLDEDIEYSNLQLKILELRESNNKQLEKIIRISEQPLESEKTKSANSSIK